jgi:hypothetical protein
MRNHDKREGYMSRLPTNTEQESRTDLYCDWVKVTASLPVKAIGSILGNRAWIPEGHQMNGMKRSSSQRMTVSQSVSTLYTERR